MEFFSKFFGKAKIHPLTNNNNLKRRNIHKKVSEKMELKSLRQNFLQIIKCSIILKKLEKILKIDEIK